MPRIRSSNTTLSGGNRSEFLSTKRGDDTINAGGGNGGSGFDKLRVNITAARLADPALLSELSAYLDALDAGTAPNWVLLPTLNLSVRSIEAVEIYVDGVLTDPRDTVSGGDLIAQDDTFDVTEDATVSDDVSANDTAPIGAVFTLLSPVSDGTLVLNDNGSFTYASNGAYDSLAVGEAAAESFTYQISANGETASIDLLQNASDVDNGAVLSVANVAGLVSELTLTDSTLTVDANDPAFAGLGPGDSLTLVVAFDVVDSDGGSVAQTVTATIIGSNDAPVVTGPILADVWRTPASS